LKYCGHIFQVLIGIFESQFNLHSFTFLMLHAFLLGLS